MAKLKIDIVHDLHKNITVKMRSKSISSKIRGDVVCIIGPSEVLVNQPSTQSQPSWEKEVTKGQITVNGYDLTDPKTNIIIVPWKCRDDLRHLNLFPHMSVIENIMLLL